MSAKPVKLDIYKAAIPMRSFEHAAASRNESLSIITKLEYDSGKVGWGQTLPRDYVTGETLGSVPQDLEKLWEICTAENLLDLDCAQMPREIPTELEGRFIGAAACCLDLASCERIFSEDSAHQQAVLKFLTGKNAPAKKISARVSGILGSANPAKTKKRLRLMKLGGLRDFKLKLGFGEQIDKQNLEITHRALAKLIRRGKASLRVDINGGWAADKVSQNAAKLLEYDVCAIEQPVFCTASELAKLAADSPIPLMGDESLLTMKDAHELATAGDKILFNVRISKAGGILPALKMLQFASEKNIAVSQGCMVGETSILSAAQRKLLAIAPAVRFAEGNWGKLLLGDDILHRGKALRFGYAGKLTPLKKPGLGIEICEDKIAQYCKLIKTLRC